LLSNTTANVGQIVTYTVSPGSSYNKTPFIRLYDKLAAGANRTNQYLSLTGLTGNFANGEVITQAASGALGKVMEANSTSVLVECYSIMHPFVLTTNTTTTIIGADSAVQANITFIDDQDYGECDGFNFLFGLHTQQGMGAIDGLQVIDSGFGFINEEAVTILAANGAIYTSAASAILLREGYGSGRYKQKGGFLSDEKKLFDGYYWQNLSYEVRSSLELNKYRDLLKKIMHLAGTQLFGAVYNKTVANVEVDILCSVTQN